MKKEKLGELVIASEDMMYHVAKTLLYNDADCADAIQETIVKAFTKLHTLKSDAYAKTWLTRILINECYAIMRREKKIVSLEDYNMEEPATEQENTKIDEIPDITMETSYLPDGMVELEEGKYSYEKTPYEGGVSIIFYRMDMGDSAFEILDTYVTESENLQIGNHDGVYLKMQENDGDWLSFNQRIYVTYPEYHYVMQMYIGEDVTKDEALKIAEGVKIIPVADETEENMVHAWNWSDYLASIEEDDDSWEKDAATAEEMKIHTLLGKQYSRIQKKIYR